MNRLFPKRVLAIPAIIAAIVVAPGPTPALCQTNAPSHPSAKAATAPLPKLLDLGATKCIPCKMMAPILEQLKKDFAGRLQVEFIDVWQNPDAAKQYKIEVIPTQIFYDATGKELSRHIGFISREDILAKWKQLGVDVNAQAAPPSPGSTKRD